MKIEIRVQGHMDEHWSVWFDDLLIKHLDPDETVITGSLRDQSAFYGLIAKLRNLGLSIQYMQCVNQK
jgi:hypothetical protein